MSLRTKEWILVSVLVLTIVAWSLLTHSMTEEMKEHLGDQVVIDSDTTTIVDYSIWGGEYTLSDGTTISKEFLNE